MTRKVVLDAIFVLGFGWGMKGAAIATVIGQILNFAIKKLNTKGTDV